MGRLLRRLAVTTVAATLTLALAGVASAAGHIAMVRVVHASPDAPNVDVAVDGSVVLSDVPFTAVSDYLELEPGTYNITVSPTGTTDAVIDADLTFEAGKGYTVAAIGLVADIGAAVFEDDLTTEAGKAKLRAIHLSPSAPSPVDIAVQGGDVVVPGLAYPEASGYLSLDPGNYPLEIRAAGEMDAALQFEVDLAADTTYTAFAMDAEGGVQVIAAADAMAAESPDTSMATGSLSATLLAGLALIGLAVVIAGRRLAARPVR